MLPLEALPMLAFLAQESQFLMHFIDLNIEHIFHIHSGGEIREPNKKE